MKCIKEMLTLELPFLAVGESRPRVFVNPHTKKIQAISPSKRNRAAFRKLLFMHYHATPLCGSLEVEIECQFPPPASHSAKRRREMIGKPKLTKPDVDNVLKFILDAGNMILWEDDRQITKVLISKIYGPEPKIKLAVKEASDESE